MSDTTEIHILFSEGKENAPEECYDSDATVTEILSE